MADGPPEPRTPVFLDASVLVAGAGSPNGGSAVAMDICQGQRFRAVVSTGVLTEARDAIARKLGEGALLRFYQRLAGMLPEVAPTPPSEQSAAWVDLVTKKDAHVLAAAIESRAAYLLTLDRQHLLRPRVLEANLPLVVMTPGDFIHLATGMLDGP